MVAHTSFTTTTSSDGHRLQQTPFVAGIPWVGRLDCDGLRLPRSKRPGYLRLLRYGCFFGRRISCLFGPGSLSGLLLPSGPVHPYMHAFFFYLFGFNKTAILVHLVVVNAIVVAATFFLARRHLPLLDSFFMALLSAICFYGPTAHPWYDENAWLWLVLGILVVEIGGTLEGTRAFFLSAFLCGLLVGLSFLTKSNIGLVGGVVFFVYFLVQQRPARLIAIYCAGGLVGLAGIIGLLESPPDFIFQNFLAFDWKTRLGYVDRFWFVLTYLPYTLFLATLSVMACLGGKAYIQAKPESTRHSGGTAGGLDLRSVFRIQASWVKYLSCRHPDDLPFHIGPESPQPCGFSGRGPNL